MLAAPDGAHLRREAPVESRFCMGKSFAKYRSSPFARICAQSRPKGGVETTVSGLCQERSSRRSETVSTHYYHPTKRTHQVGDVSSFRLYGVSCVSVCDPCKCGHLIACESAEKPSSTFCRQFPKDGRADAVSTGFRVLNHTSDCLPLTTRRNPSCQSPARKTALLHARQPSMAECVWPSSAAALIEARSMCRSACLPRMAVCLSVCLSVYAGQEQSFFFPFSP